MIKKAIIFSELNYGDKADLCTCPHCDNVIGDTSGETAILVPCGTRYCPDCGEELMWYDSPECQEIDFAEIINDENIELFDFPANFLENYDDENGTTLYSKEDHKIVKTFND